VQFLSRVRLSPATGITSITDKEQAQMRSTTTPAPYAEALFSLEGILAVDGGWLAR